MMRRIFMKVNGLEKRKMEEESKSRSMEQDMTDSGRKIDMKATVD
jgi:hypothetical protein